MVHEFSKFAAVLLDVSIDKPLDYGIPDELIDKVKRGMRVAVPVRGFLRYGYVLGVKDTPDYPRVQPIKKLISEEELLTDHLLELAIWIGRYYGASLRQVLKTMLPASVRRDGKHKEQLFIMRGKTRDQLKEICVEIRNKYPAQATVLDAMLKVKKGILLSELLEQTQGSRSPVESLVKKGHLLQDIVRVDRSPLVNEQYFQTKPKKLNTDQQHALDQIVKNVDNRTFETHLLYGVTGSGKTEVYLQAIDRALSYGLGVIVLVPEISLTAQTIERFRSRFEGHIAVLHHRLSHGERFDEWHKIRRGEAKIVIGARSAIFSPVKDLGLIIVDEEHEQSYKQSEEAPRYHAREVAVMRGNMLGCPIVLGSATPCLESFHNAKKGKYTLSTLPSRADTASLPQVTIVDMKKEFEKAKGYTSFSDPLLTGIKKRQEVGEQTILFLNRRGYHTTLLCQKCSHVVKCSHCDVALTFHKNSNSLSCHLCSFTLSPPPKLCPQCRADSPMRFRGIGTEQVQKALHAIMPEVRTIRIDADTTRHKGSHQKLLREFGSGKADVLIGTQMIAKGLHFPEVTLVGVLNSDASLNIPDFRASETVFQLITQVAGRAGRGTTAGEVLIQTCMPENRTIQLAAQQDYQAFFEEEIGIRELFHYPPFTNLAKITFSGTNPRYTQQWAEEYQRRLVALLPSSFEATPVVPSGHAKIKDHYRFQFLARGHHIYALNDAISQLSHPKDIKVSVDINPTSTYF